MVQRSIHLSCLISIQWTCPPWQYRWLAQKIPDFAVGLLFLLLLDLEVLCKDIAADLPDLAAVSLSAGQGNGQSSELELLIRGADTELLLDLEAAVPSEKTHTKCVRRMIVMMMMLFIVSLQEQETSINCRLRWKE